MRYIGAAMRIETARVRFAFEWEHLVAPLKGKDPAEDEVRELLDAIERFSLAIREAVEQETGAWIAEFQTNLAQLDKETKALFEGAHNEKKAIEQSPGQEREEEGDDRVAARPSCFNLQLYSDDDRDRPSLSGHDVAKSPLRGQFRTRPSASDLRHGG